MLESPHPSLQTVKKVDIIVSHAFLEETLSVLDVVGVSGYTVFGSTSGKGDRGLSCDDLDCDSDRGTSKLKSLCSMEYRHRLPKKISNI
jgi:nitrogen regulatory protein PII